MTEADVFQLLGLVVAAAGLGMLMAPAFYARMGDQIAQMPMIVYMGGIIRIVLGYLLIRYFTYWAWDWRLILTLMGWVSLIAGVLIIILPEQFVGLAARMLRNIKNVRRYAVGATAVGLLLMYLGFFVV